MGASNIAVTVGQSTLPLSTATTVTATVKKTDGTPAAGTPVTFTTSLGTLAPVSGSTTGTSSVTVNADNSGVATATLNSGTTSGPGQLAISATVDGKLLTGTQLFNVTLPALKLANLQLTNNSGGSISYGSSQGITVEVLDAATNQPYTAQPVSVVFGSSFATQDKAKISSPVTTVNGKAATTYTATTGTGTDTITASISGGSTQTIALTVSPLAAGAISFVSASPATIGLKGMGGAGIEESSRVTFKVVDTSGAPKANQPVTFALNTNAGGLKLISTTGSTGADGTVSTTVQSGNIATPVRITASTNVGGAVVSTQSDQLVVSTGVPAQDGFSVSRVNSNPEAWGIDGVTTVVTARLSDHFHNPVPDGTAVYFTTSGGSIVPSCVTVKGACSVSWTSQNPRPSTPRAKLAGRAVVLAYAIGEEAFVDLDGNGVAGAGEFQDDPEAFRDDNENGVFDKGLEPFIDFNTNGSFDAGDLKYNGVLQGTSYLTAPKSKHVFSNSVIIMSSSEAVITSSVASIAAPGRFSVTVKDINGNTMPSGTSITVTAPFGKLTGQTTYTVPLNSGFGVTLPLDIEPSGATTTQQSGLITVAVKSPGGLTTSLFIPVSGMF